MNYWKVTYMFGGILKTATTINTYELSGLYEYNTVDMDNGDSVNVHNFISLTKTTKET